MTLSAHKIERPEWTDEEMDCLLQLWKDPKNTLSVIAKQMTERFRRVVTRNMVVGKIDRLKALGKAEGRPSPLKPRVNEKPKRRRGFRSQVIEVVIHPTRARQPCCWITTKDKPWCYCDAPSLPGRPYCEEHYLRSVEVRKPNADAEAHVRRSQRF